MINKTPTINNGKKKHKAYMKNQHRNHHNTNLKHLPRHLLKLFADECYQLILNNLYIVFIAEREEFLKGSN